MLYLLLNCNAYFPYLLAKYIGLFAAGIRATDMP